jgi:hypothetical protein
MTNEASLNTIIKMSLDFGYKIPDPTNKFSATIPRPFDLFGIINSKPIYIEAKYSPELKSFDLQRIEDHQIANLIKIKNLLPNSYCWIVYGVHCDHGDNRIYIFDDILEIERRRLLKLNYLKKELISLPYIKIYKGIADFNKYITNYIQER